MNKLALTTAAILLATTFSTTAQTKYTTETVYDDNANVTGYHTYSYNNGSSGNITFMANYDADGNLIRSHQYTYGEAVVPEEWGENVFPYTALSAEIYSRELGYTLKTSSCLGYEASGQCIGGEAEAFWDSWDLEGAEILCQGLCSATYDSEGNIAILTYYDTQISKTKLSEESFDSNGNLTQRITYDSDGTTILGTETFAYDSDGDLLSKISYDANGNPISTENYALKIYTVEQAYAATSKGNHNTFSIRFK